MRFYSFSLNWIFFIYLYIFSQNNLKQTIFSHLYVHIVLEINQDLCISEILFVSLKLIFFHIPIYIFSKQFETNNFLTFICILEAMEVKNNHAHVTTQRILNKFIEINFYVGCMVWPWWCLFQHGLSVKILIRYIVNWELETP